MTNETYKTLDLRRSHPAIEPCLKRRVRKSNDPSLWEWLVAIVLCLAALYLVAHDVFGFRFIPTAHAEDTVSADQVRSAYGACVYAKEHPGGIINADKLHCI